MPVSDICSSQKEHCAKSVQDRKCLRSLLKRGSGVDGDGKLLTAMWWAELVENWLRSFSPCGERAFEVFWGADIKRKERKTKTTNRTSCLYCVNCGAVKCPSAFSDYVLWMKMNLSPLFCEKKKNTGILPVTVLWPLGISCLLTKSCLILRRIWVWRPELCGSLHQVTKYTLMILRTWGCI